MTRADVNRRRLIFAGTVAVVALVAYANSFDGEFVWDDRALILQSPVVQSTSGLAELFSGDFFSHSQIPLPYGYYRPITTLSYVVDWWLWGDDPTGFHITNFALHAIASILVFLLLLRLRVDETLSLTVAALFAVHPIHTESVTWISGRTDVLAFVFAAAAMLVALYADGGGPKAAVLKKARGKGRREPRSKPPLPHQPRPFLTALAVALFAVALLAKEMAAVLPLWIFLVAAIHERSSLKRAALRAFPFLMVIAAYAVLRFAIVQVATPGQPVESTMAVTILSAPFTVVRYLWWMLLPVDLSAYAQNPYVTKMADIRFLGSVAVLSAIAVGSVRLAKRNREILLFTSMLAVSFLPVLNIIRVSSPVDMGSTMAERFCYFPSFPFLAAIAVTVSLFLPRTTKRRRIARATLVTLFLLVPSAAICWDRADAWRDEISLFSGMVRQAPEAVLPWSQLSLAHIRQGQPMEARRTLEKAEQIDSTDLRVLSTHTTLLVVEGRTREAIPFQERLVRAAGPASPVATNNLAYLYRMVGRFGDSRQLLEKVIENGDAYADVWFNLAEVEHREGNFEGAVVAFQRAWESNKRDPRYRERLAHERIEYSRLLARTGQRDGAAVQLQKALAHTEDAKLKQTAISELNRLGSSAAPPVLKGDE